jgi:hypothetical protein
MRLVIQKDQKEFVADDFVDGQEFSAKIRGTLCKGKICIHRSENNLTPFNPNSIFLCQSEVSGTDYHAVIKISGFPYAWYLSSKESFFIDSDVTELKLQHPSDIEVRPIELQKLQKDLTFHDFYHGQRFTAFIGFRRLPASGRITIEDERVYLCQNKVDGVRCRDTQGYKYSFLISQNKILKFDDINDLRIEQHRSKTPFTMWDLRNGKVYRTGDTVFRFKGFVGTHENIKLLSCQSVSSATKKLLFSEQIPMDGTYRLATTEEERWLNMCIAAERYCPPMEFKLKSVITINPENHVSKKGEPIEVGRLTSTIVDGQKIRGNTVSGRTNKSAVSSRPLRNEAVIVN